MLQNDRWQPLVRSRKAGIVSGIIFVNFSRAVISLDLQGAVEKIESGLKGETNEWKSRAVDLIWPSVKARTRHARFTCKRRTSAFFPLRKLSSRVAQRRRYPPCLSKILSLFADVPSLGLLSWTNHLDGKEISRGQLHRLNENWINYYGPQCEIYYLLKTSLIKLPYDPK